jgi:cell division protein FtsI (penicillin-binding protein 3)
MTKPVSRWSKVSIGAISMGQEIGVSPVQLAAMMSTIANDGVYVAPRIIAGTTPPRSTPQLITFHPALGRRVVAPMTAAQMKHMLEGVVLHGTGPKAILDGYSVAGKTGTAQKIDRETGKYSHRQHIASFSGFAPINNPAVSILVVLDTPATYPRDQGGDVAAPVFARVAQQVLGYLNVPHDIPLQDIRRQTLRAKANNEDVSEAAPDYIAEAAEPAGAPVSLSTPAPALQASTARVDDAHAKPTPVARERSAPVAPVLTATAVRGTVVLDTAGGVLVPDFHGKALRTALEEAQAAGIELEISGSGVGREQSPQAGSKITPGGHVVVHFGR